MAFAALTCPRASRRDSPAASARTWVPPSPWRSRMAMAAAALVWNEETIANSDFDRPSARRRSADDAVPS